VARYLGRGAGRRPDGRRTDGRSSIRRRGSGWA
jgi:hypothetical protein